MVELRKRKEPPAAPTSTKSTTSSKKRATSKSTSSTPAPAPKAARGKKAEKESSMAAGEASGEYSPGDMVPVKELEAIKVQTDDGAETTLPTLLEKSPEKSMAIFTYPKASTPGCTNQACLFRDSYEELTPSFEVYGLSNDSPKSNTNFKEKQKLPYTLLCDPKRELITKLGFAKAGGGTTRGVVIIAVDGKILAWTKGGPQPTLDAVKAVMPKSDTKL